MECELKTLWIGAKLVAIVSVFCYFPKKPEGFLRSSIYAFPLEHIVDFAKIGKTKMPVHIP